MKRLAITFAAALLTLTPAGLRAEGPVTIKREMKAGRTYFMDFEMHQETNMEIGGQKMKQEMDMEFGYKLAVTKHESPGKRHAKLTYTRVAAEMKMPGQTMRYDSAEPGDSDDSNPFAQALSKIKGTSVEMVLNEKDDVQEVKGMDEIKKSMGPMSQMFGKETFSQMMKIGNLQAPDKPLNPGDKWPLEISIPVPALGKMTMSGECTYVKNVTVDEKECAEVKLDGKIAVAGGDGEKKSDAAKEPAGEAADAQAEMLKKMDMKMNGTFTATIAFDTALGMERKTDYTMNMTMSMKNPAGEGRMTIPMKQRMLQTLKKVEE